MTHFLQIFKNDISFAKPVFAAGRLDCIGLHRFSQNAVFWHKTRERLPVTSGRVDFCNKRNHVLSRVDKKWLLFALIVTVGREQFKYMLICCSWVLKSITAFRHVNSRWIITCLTFSNLRQLCGAVLSVRSQALPALAAKRVCYDKHD